jgi:hypothetical protein
MSENEDDWNERERALLDTLSPVEAPPPQLEARVLAEMKRSGLVRSRRLPWMSAAAAAATLAIGLVVGRATVGARAPRPSAPATDRTFILLLYPGSGQDPSPAAEQGRVAEYGRWARGLRADGRLVSGEKLKDGVKVFGGASAPSSESLQGYFVIRAATMEEAEGIARTCPHRGHGGAVALREIDPT